MRRKHAAPPLMPAQKTTMRSFYEPADLTTATGRPVSGRMGAARALSAAYHFVTMPGGRRDAQITADGAFADADTAAR